MKFLSNKIRNNISGFALLLIFFLIKPAATFSNDEGNEYKIKAMFVLNFMKYVEWPSRMNDEVFKIGVVGESEIYDALQTMITNRQETKKIRIDKLEADSKGEYQIIIIPRNLSKKADEWTKKYQGKGVLIITEEFKSTSNSSINLLTINNKIRFELNYAQAKRDGIKISSRLAEMAVSIQQ